MQLKCRVRKRFGDESGITERYDRYIAKAAIYGTINYTPISFDAIHSVCALPEPSKNTHLFNLLYTRKHEVALNKSGIKFAGITTTLAAVDAFVLGCVSAVYELEPIQWEDRCVICHTKKQHHNYNLYGGAYCMFNFITIIKPTIIPSIRRVREGLLFCEPHPIRLIWSGYKCN